MSTPRPGTAPDAYVELLRPYSRLLAETILHELQAARGRSAFDAVTEARKAMSRAVRSANRAPGTDADGEAVDRRDPVADVADRLERLREGGTIEPVTHAARSHVGRAAEAQLAKDVLVYVCGSKSDWAEVLRKPDVAAAFVEVYTERHAARSAALVAERDGDPDVFDVVASRGLSRLTVAKAARIVGADEAQNRITAFGLDELQDQSVDVASERVPAPVADGGWALLSRVLLLRALYECRDVLATPRIGHQLNLVLAELLCLVGAGRVGWGSEAWQVHDAPRPLEDCPDHPDPFTGALPSRGKERWNRGMFLAMEAAIEAPQCGTGPIGPPVDADDWVGELVDIHRKSFGHPKAGKPRIVFAGQAADGDAAGPERWASQLLTTKTTLVFRTYVQVCIVALLAYAEQPEP